MIRIVRIGGLLLSLALASCDSSIEPLSSRGAYVLQSIADDPLPAPYTPNTAVNYQMLYASMVLEEDGEGQWFAVVEGDGGEAYDQESEFTYTRAGNTIAITLACPPNASCVAGPHFVGALRDGGLYISTSNVMRTPLVFDQGPMVDGR